MAVSRDPVAGRVSQPGVQMNRTGWMRWVPGLHTLRRYEPSWLRHDIVAGLVMTTMLVPVGIASRGSRLALPPYRKPPGAPYSESERSGSSPFPPRQF
jgi:hypothetical protein